MRTLPYRVLIPSVTRTVPQDLHIHIHDPSVAVPVKTDKLQRVSRVPAAELEPAVIISVTLPLSKAEFADKESALRKALVTNARVNGGDVALVSLVEGGVGRNSSELSAQGARSMLAQVCARQTLDAKR